MARRRRPRDPGALALWPGAGSSSDHPALMALEEGLAPLPVGRFDFPYRREGRRAPDRAPKLLDSLRADAAAFCHGIGIDPGRLVLGGRSMGGRMCSVAVAGGPVPNAAKGTPDAEPIAAAGLVLISYPLHPPGRPDRLRTEHLGRLRCPVLFISGDRDPFGTTDELVAAQAEVPGPVTNVVVPGGRHELKGAEDLIVAAVRDWLSG
ncbi:MAG: alpha/beta family hydrolase [Microthrixaceae bacterium]